MSYSALWINRLAQYGAVQYDVIYSDDANILPIIRLNKSFDIAEDTDVGRAAIEVNDILSFQEEINQ